MTLSYIWCRYANSQAEPHYPHGPTDLGGHPFRDNSPLPPNRQCAHRSTRVLGPQAEVTCHSDSMRLIVRFREVLEKAMPVSWKHGFADTSLQELERATVVNKSGLYTEFRDKEDLFVACLRHYLESRGLLVDAPHRGAFRLELILNLSNIPIAHATDSVKSSTNCSLLRKCLK
jgi:hypothetical protein